MNEQEAVIVFVLKKYRNAEYVLLAIKRKKIGRGYYVLPGGKIADGETPKEAAVRELLQETGIKAEISGLEYTGVLLTHNYTWDKTLLRWQLLTKWRVHMYITRDWVGTPVETKELEEPRWFRRFKRDLPLSNMLPCDQYLIPRVLDGRNIGVRICNRLHHSDTPDDTDAPVLVTLHGKPDLLWDIRRLS